MLLSTSWRGLGAAVSSLSPYLAFLLSCLLGIYLIFLIDFHTESLVQANRATLQRTWDWDQNPSYANKAGAAFPVDPLCGFLLAPGKAFSLLTGPKVSKRPAPSSTPPHWESRLFALLFQQVHLCHKTRGVQMSDACQLSWG